MQEMPPEGQQPTGSPMQISSDNTFTTPQLVQGMEGFDVAVSGTFTATITVQLSKDGATNWFDSAEITQPDVVGGLPHTAWFVRAGIKTGNYTSGTATVEVH